VLASSLESGTAPLPRATAAAAADTGKVALVFGTQAVPPAAWAYRHSSRRRDGAPHAGNEYRGVSAFWTRAADALFTLPMAGFVQSYNVSTSVAMALYHLRLDSSAWDAHRLSEADQDAVALRWHLRDVRRMWRALRSAASQCTPDPRLGAGT
jgi:hypothetical protein